MRDKIKGIGRKMRRWHKWVGLISIFFILMFAGSGIFLNHRKAISGVDVSRSLLPDKYRYSNWNNGAVKGSFKLSSDSILVYGGSGIWLTDSLFSYFAPFSEGIKQGAENRIVGNVVGNKDMAAAVTTFGLYLLDDESGKWEDISDRVDSKERFCDIATYGDTLVLLTRSHIFSSFSPYEAFHKQELMAPEGYKKETTLFRTLWTLHSGELFHLPGRLFVDLLGVAVILLCFTGIVVTISPKLRRHIRSGAKSHSKKVSTLLRNSLTWHNKVGVVLLGFLLLLVLTGTFLRPPLLITIIGSKVGTIPGTSLNSDNPWFDKLRTIRYDRSEDEWLIYTSDGFYSVKKFTDTPYKLTETPPVNVMGVTVLEQLGEHLWAVGSFSGLFYWNREAGVAVDAYTHTIAPLRRGGMPIFGTPVSGFSRDFKGNHTSFEYEYGARVLNRDEVHFADMPESLHKEGRISLWHLCLEIHTGRIYEPILGFFTDWFIFFSGALFLSILISGYLVYRKHYKKKERRCI